MPIFETYVVWTDADDYKSVGSPGPVYRESQQGARAYAKDWAERAKGSLNFKSYEIVVRQVLEQ